MFIRADEVWYSRRKKWTGWWHVYEHSMPFPKGIAFAKFLNERSANEYIDFLHSKIGEKSGT